MDDQYILELYNARSESAIAVTAAQYGRYCHSIAFQILQNTQDSEEVVSETFLRAWNAIPPACPSCLRLDLGKIARHVSLHLLEKRYADKRGGDSYHVALEELAECIPSSESPNTITDAMIIRDTLDTFLDTLPMDEKYTFIRRYWYMDSIESIAKHLHKTNNSVYVLLHRIREKLRKTLEKEGIVI